MTPGFIARNPKYCLTQDPRKTWVVIKAMKAYDKSRDNTCEYCGRKGNADVHHVKDISHHPELAAEKSNMICLCRKPQCHLIIGHMGDFKGINPNVREVCLFANPKGSE